jgi:hypothetical protein
MRPSILLKQATVVSALLVLASVLAYANHSADPSIRLTGTA